MNIKQIIRIAFILIGVSIAGNAVLFVMGESPFNFAKINEKRSISAESIDDIEVSTSIADVTVKPHDGDKIEIYLKGNVEKKNEDNLKLSITNKKNKIIIETTEQQKRHYFSVFSGDYELSIKLPRDEFNRLQVNSDAASITFNEVKAEHVDITTDMGNIFLNDVVGAVSAKSDVGDIDVVLQKIEKDITAKSDVGDITIKTKQEPKQLRTHLSNSIGEEIVKLPNMKNGTIGIGGPLVVLKSDVGDLALMMFE
jgi:Putative adhesin